MAQVLRILGEMPSPNLACSHSADVFSVGGDGGGVIVGELNLLNNRFNWFGSLLTP